MVPVDNQFKCSILISSVSLSFVYIEYFSITTLVLILLIVYIKFIPFRYAELLLYFTFVNVFFCKNLKNPPSPPHFLHI